MTVLSAFEWVCQELERAGGLETSVARGTVRLALREAGLDSDSVDAAQMRIVAEKVLPGELRSLRLEGVDEIRDKLLQGLARHTFVDATDRAGAAASILDRLGT